MSQPFPKQSAPALGDLPEEEFRKALHQVADWALNYRSGIAERAISAQGKPGEFLQLPTRMPEDPVPLQKFSRSSID